MAQNQGTNTAEQNLPFIAFVTLVATLGGFLFGFDSGVINGTVDGLRTSFNSDSVGTGLNVASMLLGCAIGAFFAGRLADTYGRKTMLLVASVLFLISAWGSGISTQSAEFVFYRILGGLAVGAASVIAPAYISEIAPTHIRGRLTSVQQIAIISGLFFAFLSNFFLAELSGGSVSELWLGYESWRWMFWVELIPALLFLIALIFIPESPRYEVIRGRSERAQATLSKLFNAQQAATMVEDIQASIDTSHRPRFSDLIDKQSKKIKAIVWVGIGLATFQQLVGINVVFYYGAVLWQAVGFNESDALLINVISGAISIAACFITFARIDHWGRKPFLIVGSIGMALTLALVALAFSQGELLSNGQLKLSETSGLIALVSANLYVFFFNISWGPVMWIALGEMFPNQIRGTGLAIAGLAQWSSNFLITVSFPILLTGIGLSAAYAIYAFCALVSIAFVIKFVHETKGIDLEEMEALSQSPT
ncbi:sugar porter family MFS transporter [Agaribacterium sp. ZY112]|uniref:sugar porter family MFS transporter n=1 Tax=Agaribacterium sp. ZY112 TaxID=3233574 RepID=UPI003525A8DB